MNPIEVTVEEAPGAKRVIGAARRTDAVPAAADLVVDLGGDDTYEAQVAANAVIKHQDSVCCRHASP